MKRLGLAATVLMLLSGCAANGFYEGVHDDTPEDIEKYTDKKFFGVPVLLGLEGSSVKLDNQWRATVAHNKWLLIGQEVYYHPRCDFALIKVEDTGEEPDLGLILDNEKVFHTGYPVFGFYSSHEGKYLADVKDNSDDCTYSTTDATLISGMSGGGVFNEKGAVAGVNVGIMFGVDWKDNPVDVSNPAVFMSLLAVRDFIFEVTGKNLYPEFDTYSNQLTEEEKKHIKEDLK